eukprot:627482-Pelagomonas_calceolata.AAC.2
MQQAREASKELVRMRADLRKRPGEFQVPTNKLQKVGSMLINLVYACLWSIKYIEMRIKGLYKDKVSIHSGSHYAG